MKKFLICDEDKIGGNMLSSGDAVFNSFCAKLGKRVDASILEQLAAYTFSKHIGKSSKDLDSIFFIGKFDSEADAMEKIDESRWNRYVYDHKIIVDGEEYYLFQFNICPYD